MNRLLVRAIFLLLLTGMAAAQTVTAPTTIVLLGIGHYTGATLQSRFPASNWPWYSAWVTDGPTCGGGGLGPAVLCYSDGNNWLPISAGGGPGGGPTSISALTPATAVNNLNNGSFSQNWNWTLTGTSSMAGLAISENAASTNTGPYSVLVGINTLAGSTVPPFESFAHSGTAGLRIDASGNINAVGTAIFSGPFRATNITGVPTQCVQADPGGNLTGTGVACGSGTGGTGWGSVVPNPFTTIQAAINTGGPVIVLPTSADKSAYTNLTSVRIQNFKQNQFGADSLFFRDVSEWGPIDGQTTTYCATTAGSNSVSCGGVTFVNASAPAGDVGKLIIIPGAGAGTYGQVYGGNSGNTSASDLKVSSVTGLTAGTPNSYQGVVFTDAGDCYSNSDGTPNWDNQPYGHVWLDASGLPSGNVITVSGNNYTTGVVDFNNFLGKGCTHPPTVGTINTVGGTVHFTGGTMVAGDLVTSITAVTGSNGITVADNATYAGSFQSFYGTDAYPTFQAACNNISTNSGLVTGGTLTFSGIALISHGIDCNGAGLRILGRASEGFNSVIIYAGKTPNNMMNGNKRATGGPIASPIIPNSYILNLSRGGAAKIERIHLIGNTVAMPYGIINSFGNVCYGQTNPPNGPYNIDCFQSPGSGNFISQAHIIDQVVFNPFWGDGYPDNRVARMQSCIFFAGFTGNADFMTMDHVYCYGADVGMDSVNDQATDLTVGKWQSDYSNIGISFSGGITVADYYTEGNRADFVMGSPYWQGGFPEIVNMQSYSGESSGMDFGGASEVSYNCYNLVISGGLGGGSGYRRPDGITADFVNGVPPGNAATCVNTVSWSGSSPGNILIPYDSQGGPFQDLHFNGGFTSTQFRFPAGSGPYNPSSGWGISNNRLVINNENLDYSTPANMQDWGITLVPTPGSSLLSMVMPTLLHADATSQITVGTLNVRSVNWGTGYGTGPYVVCNNIMEGNTGYVACGSTVYNYQVTCVDSLGGESLPAPNDNAAGSVILTTSPAPANLGANPGNYINIQTWPRPGCAAFNVYGDNGVGGCIGFLTSSSSEGMKQYSAITDRGAWTKNCSRVPPTASTMGSITAAGSVAAGSAVTAGTAPAGCPTSGAFCATETTASGTPTPGTDWMRADSASHTWKCSFNGAAETTCGGGGSPVTSRTWSWVYSGVVQGGAVSFPVFFPSVNAPTYLNPVTPDGIGKFYIPSGSTSAYFYTSLVVPPSQSGNYTINLTYDSTDSTNTAAITLYSSCGAIGSSSNATLAWTTTGQTLPLHASASSADTLASNSSVSVTCAAGSKLYFKFLPTTNALTGNLQISVVTIQTQGQL